MGFGANIEKKTEHRLGELLDRLVPSDLVQFGLIPEFIGRIPVITHVEELTVDDLLRVMTDTLHETKIKTDLHIFTVCRNGGKQPMEITGEVPDNYKRIVYETDTEKIRAALEAGEELTFAHLNERGTHLMIK
jgi:hypothetical protein